MQLNKAKFSPYLFLFPALIILLLFRIWPILSALYDGFFAVRMGTRIGFVGFQHYMDILSDSEFLQALKNTLWFVVITVPLSLILALPFALLLNKPMRLLGLYRSIYFLPAITSMAAIALVWKWLLHPRMGLVNGLLAKWGIAPLQWLDEPTGVFQLVANSFGANLPPYLQGPSLALVSLVMVAVWRSIGYNIVILLAGLQNIPNMYYEAAKLDGAKSWTRFKHITWPLLSPTTYYVLIMTTIVMLQTFTEVYMMTGPPAGSPLGTTSTIVLYMYGKGFGAGSDMGAASAVAMILFIIILTITLIQKRFIEPKVHYQ